MLRIATDPTLDKAYLGTYSITYGRKKRTEVSSHHRWCGEPVSASTIARMSLEESLKSTGRKRIFWNKRCWHLLDVPHPLHCDPLGHSETLIYVDIKGCYYNLYRHLPIYLFYWGLKPICGDSQFKDFLPTDIDNYKLVRNSVVGVFRCTRSTRVFDRKIVGTDNHNKFLAPCHWGAMAEMLHHFAHMAMSLGARYYNTDGAIFTSEESAVKWSSQIQEWGLQTEIKAIGSGHISAIGAYSIGGKNADKRFVRPHGYSNLHKPNPYILDMYQRLL